MLEVRRIDDGELCGHVVASAEGWRALTVFGGTLGVHDRQQDAEAQVLAEGLASLAERWSYRPVPGDDWQVVCIQEANAEEVRIALGHYSMPGVPTVTLTRAQLAAGASLVRDPDEGATRW